uniref:RNA polymerase II subunit B1 CTD phosphatase RPAP2 homolog n=1 Tax=Ciona savignyi TaxID=51511 RepID=H2ZGM2_CIOSA
QERDKVLIDSRKKLLAEKRAHAIVEKLLENDISEDFFLKSVYYLSVEKYADVVEERSISKQCGYAVCRNKLENIPRQQFKISRNVVYDITERKKFCSNICYKRSKFIEEQIPTYPLWLRETDGKTRISPLQSDTGLQGEKVDLLNFKPAKKEEKETSDFTQPTVPNVDSKNQIVIRRQILLKKISSSLNNIAPVLHNPSIVQDIRGLIGTFNLTSTNLVLKSNQLSVIVVMVLDLLQRVEHHSNFTVPESVGEFLKTVNIEITDIQSAVAHVIEKLISKPLCSSPV